MTGLSLTIVSQVMENTEIHQWAPSPTYARNAEHDRGRPTSRHPVDVTAGRIVIMGAASLVP